MHSRPRSWLLSWIGIGLACACLWGCGSQGRRSSDKLNLLLVTLDTTRADHMSCYGYPVETSPHFDALARDGVQFNMAIAQAAVTPVSHASILTGLNPYQHGVRVLFAREGYRLQDSVPSLATILRGKGWRTGAFLSAFPVSEFFGFDQGFEMFDNGMQGSVEKKLESDEESGHVVWNVQENQRRSDQTTQSVLPWIRKTGTPFFAWVHYWDPHDTIVLPPREILGKFLRRKAATPDAQKVAVYDAEIYFVDSQFGQLIRTLKDLGEYDNTIVVVVADHGEGLDDGMMNHGWWRHRLLYQEQIRVPLILRIPGGPAGRTVESLVRTIDIFPTILEALRIEAPAPVEGKSLWGLMNDESEPPRIAYADQLNLYDLNASMINLRPKDDLLHCVMDGSWKLIYRPRRPAESELYCLDTDPWEIRNLYKEEDLPPRARELLAELKRIDPFVAKPFGKVKEDSEAMKHLKALGYIEEEEEKKKELERIQDPEERR